MLTLYSISSNAVLKIEHFHVFLILRTPHLSISRNLNYGFMKSCTNFSKSKLKKDKKKEERKKERKERSKEKRNERKINKERNKERKTE